MKVSTAALVLSLFATPASATNWQYVSDVGDNSGDRLLVDKDSIKIRTNDGVETIGAKFMFFNQPKTEANAFVLTQDCETNKMAGELWLFGSYIKVVKRLFWSNEGSQLYDRMGATLCSYYGENGEEDEDNPNNG